MLPIALELGLNMGGKLGLGPPLARLAREGHHGRGGLDLRGSLAPGACRPTGRPPSREGSEDPSAGAWRGLGQGTTPWERGLGRDSPRLALSRRGTAERGWG